MSVPRQHDPCRGECEARHVDAGDRLRIARELAGLERAQLADRVGRSVSGIGALENGQNNIRPDVADLLAPIVKTTPEWLLYERGDPPKGYVPEMAVVVNLRPKAKTKKKAHKSEAGGLVPIIGRVGADAEGSVYYMTPAERGDMTPMPPGGTRDAVALDVRGHSMTGYADDGALIYFENQESPPTPDLLGLVCVVETADGRVLLKRLLKGSRPGLYDLESIRGPTLEDQRLRWAAEVTTIVTPRQAQRIALRHDEAG